MGMRLFLRSASSYDPPARSRRKVLPNPDPNNYKIKRSSSLHGNLLVEVNYPDCTNYEGNKILLYRETTLKQLKKQKHIDPHFARSKKFKSPVARFEPTKRGWGMGLVMLRKI